MPWLLLPLSAFAGLVSAFASGFVSASELWSSVLRTAMGTAATGLGSALKVSTNFVSAKSGMNFCMSMAIPRLAICMPST